MQLSKTYSGDLEGSSTGQMLRVRTATKGSVGYVATESVTANLNWKSGPFLLQHNGLMNRGEPTLTVSVVPDSAEEALAGLKGNIHDRKEARRTPLHRRIHPTPLRLIVHRVRRRTHVLASSKRDPSTFIAGPMITCFEYCGVRLKSAQMILIAAGLATRV
jgi:hypothetical protein